MAHWLEVYQQLPLNISPIVFAVGFFSLRWYSVTYLVGFIAVFGLLSHRIAQGEGFENSKFEIRDLIWDWLVYSAVGLLIGGRLGYVLLYDPGYYLNDPLAIIVPYDFSKHDWTGLFGMSYFGGLIGSIAASYIFIQKRKLDFRQWADFVLPAVPAGYFFGRIGNFLNGELFGRPTERPWGMYFSGAAGLRHPSQLYEAFFEGLIIFLVLWVFRKRFYFSGQSLAIYLIGYGLFRFSLEFFREPDPGAHLLFGIFTPGQLFSLAAMACGTVLGCVWSGKEKKI